MRSRAIFAALFGLGLTLGGLHAGQEQANQPNRNSATAAGNDWAASGLRAGWFCAGDHKLPLPFRRQEQSTAQAAHVAPCCSRDMSPRLLSRTYSVADLVVPIDGIHESNQGTLEGKLIELITSTVSPASWNCAGGSANIQYYPLGMALVVYQTAEVHEDIQNLLAALRRLYEPEVAIEFKIVVMSEAMAERFHAIAGFEDHSDRAAQHTVHAAMLTDRQVRGWMDMFQGDRATNVLQAPRITVFNGQRAGINVSDMAPVMRKVKHVASDGLERIGCEEDKVEVGLRCEFRPVVSADRESVRLSAKVRSAWLPKSGEFVTTRKRLDGEETQDVPCEQGDNLVRQLTLDKIVNIAPGKTMVIPFGKIMTATRSESGPPVLAKIPYLSRLVRNVGYGREVSEQFVFITARLIETKEEDVFYGRLTPLERDAKRVATPEPGAAALTASTRGTHGEGCKSVCTRHASTPAPTPWTHDRSEEQEVRPSDELRVKLPASPVVMPAMPRGQRPVCEQPPDATEVLRAIPRTRGIPLVYDVWRSDVEFSFEKIADNFGPPRFYPLIGPAQLHGCHWKCTVNFTETVESGYPFPFRCQRRRTEVVYIDKETLHLAPADAAPNAPAASDGTTRRIVDDWRIWITEPVNPTYLKVHGGIGP